MMIVRATLSSVTLFAMFTASVALGGCSQNECSGLADCPLGQLCNAAGSCVADDRPPLPAEGEGEGEGEGEPAACPDDYLEVPGASFCVARFEMREGVVSSPDGLPISDVTRDEAIDACDGVGPGFHLITNAEWQIVARDIESVGDNWSGGAPGDGTMNAGNYSAEFGAVDVDDPCATPGVSPNRFPACEDPQSPDFTRKRSHTLSNGELIWDFGGNQTEFTATDVGASAPDATTGTVCEASGGVRSAYGPASTYGCGSDANPFLFGCLEGSGGTIVIRGGFSGSEGSPWDSCPGIFYVNTNSFWAADGPTGPGFRCAFAR